MNKVIVGLVVLVAVAAGAYWYVDKNADVVAPAATTESTAPAAEAPATGSTTTP